MTTYSRKLLRRLLRWPLSDDTIRFMVGIPTMWGSLANMSKIGLAPTLVIDVGAHKGDWTRRSKTIFPEAKFRLFEADPTKNVPLESLRREFPNSVEYTIALLGSQTASNVPFHLMEAGSSVLEELTDFARATVNLEMRRLDDCCPLSESSESNACILLKLDVQGYELEVLRGAERLLRLAAAVLLEVSLVEYNKNSPLVADVILFMQERGFLVYDVCSLSRRQDGTMFQMDLIFVPKASKLRH